MRGLYLEGHSTEGSLSLKIDWAIAYSWKDIYRFCFFYFIFEGNFQVQDPAGGSNSEGRFNGGFFAVQVRGAYIWRGLYMEGLFSEFCGIL